MFTIEATFFGGRTEVFTLYAAVVNGERIFYVDFCSLSVCIFLEFVAYSIFTFRYPTVNKYSAYPTGPRIELDSTHFTCPITDPQHLRQQVRGFAMAKVISTNFFPYIKDEKKKLIVFSKRPPTSTSVACQ